MLFIKSCLHKQSKCRTIGVYHVSGLWARIQRLSSYCCRKAGPQSAHSEHAVIPLSWPANLRGQKGKHRLLKPAAEDTVDKCFLALQWNASRRIWKRAMILTHPFCILEQAHRRSRKVVSLLLSDTYELWGAINNASSWGVCGLLRHGSCNLRSICKLNPWVNGVRWTVKSRRGDGPTGHLWAVCVF